MLVVFFVAHFAWLPIALMSGDAMVVDARSKCGSRLCACVKLEPICPLCEPGKPGPCKSGEQTTRLAYFGELPDDALFAGLPIVLVALIHVAGPTFSIAEPTCSARIAMPSVATPASIAADVAVPPPRVAA